MLFHFPVSAPFDLTASNFYAYRYEHFNMQEHRHIGFEIMCAESGSAEVRVRTEEGKCAVRLKRGRFILLASGCPHRLIVTRGAPCKILNLELSPRKAEGAALSERISACGELADLYSAIPGYLLCEDTTGVAACIRRLHAELTAPGPSSGLLVEAQMLELLVAVRRSVLTQETGGGHVQKALDFIRREYAERIRVSDVADYAGISPVYLQRQIKRHTGKTVVELIAELRLAQAKKLMQNTTLPLIDIAVECGFNSRQSFYEAFTRAEGISPRSYRERLREEAAAGYRQTPYTDAEQISF